MSDNRDDCVSTSNSRSKDNDHNVSKDGSSPGEHGSQTLEGDQGRDGGPVGGRGRRRRPLLRGESIPGKHLTRQGSIDASGEETQEEQLMLRPSRAAEEMPRHRKVSRFRNFGNQIRAAEVWVSHCRFLRRLQLSRGAKDHLVSPAGSSDSDPECGPPEGSTRAPPSGRSSSSSKGTRSPCAQARYHPVNGGCVVRSSSS
ncbi:uncharacterized protein LOC125041273 [Penaeus chinensis]|uniref:uncharacterized protein LOC125041273 n=1 Tax=Penaeus chinensis TaxID=139456 RepID=UPI001FB6CD63|nr:uncharacterized protein LOC125041273 [Penaeus chinensis]